MKLWKIICNETNTHFLTGWAKAGSVMRAKDIVFADSRLGKVRNGKLCLCPDCGSPSWRAELG